MILNIDIVRIIIIIMNKFNIISYKHAEGYSADIEWCGYDLSTGATPIQQHHIVFVLDSSYSMIERISSDNSSPKHSPYKRGGLLNDGSDDERVFEENIFGTSVLPSLSNQAPRRILRRQNAWVDDELHELDRDENGYLEGNVYNATMLPSSKTQQNQQVAMPAMSLRQVSCPVGYSSSYPAARYSQASTKDKIDCNRYSQYNKYSMLCKCMEKALTLIKTLSNNGSDITVTIINYSSTATVRTENSPVTEDIMSNIDEWLKPLGSTNFGDALLKAREVAGKQTERKVSTVLVSDGYNTSGYSDDKIREEFFNSVDLSIGIGSASDYNEELMVAIGKEFRGTPDEYIFRDSFASFVFGSTTCVARNIKVAISTPFITPVSGDENGFEVEDFHSHRHLPFFVKGDAEVVITYTLTKDAQEKTDKFVISSFLAKDNDASAMEIYLYCDIARKVSNGLVNKEEIKKFIKIMDTFLDDHRQADSCSGIRGLLVALKNNLKRATAEKNCRTFKGLMRNTSSQTQKSQFDSVTREVSNDIVMALTQSDTNEKVV